MTLLFIVLILENIIQQFIPFNFYLDEFLTLFFLLLIILKFSKKVLVEKKVFLFFVCFIAVLVIGILGNLIYDMQFEKIAILKDILAFSKFFITFFFCSTVLSQGMNTKTQFNIVLFSKIYTTILFVFGILSQFFDLNMNTGYRAGINTFCFLYTHTTFLVANVVVICSVLISDNFKKNQLYVLMDIIVLLLTVRDKAFVYIASIILLYFFLNSKENFDAVKLKKYKKFVYLSLPVVIVLIRYLAKDKIQGYFSWGLYAARPALYIVGAKIFFDFFPLGTGFGTFASSISGKYKSPVYEMYNIQNTSGLSEEDHFQYISDTFWPYVIGQFGFLGTLFYLMSLFYIWKTLQAKYFNDKGRLIASVSLFLYIIAACFVESVMTNSSIILFTLTLGYYLNSSLQNKTRSIEI